MLSSPTSMHENVAVVFNANMHNRRITRFDTEAVLTHLNAEWLVSRRRIRSTACR